MAHSSAVFFRPRLVRAAGNRLLDALGAARAPSYDLSRTVAIFSSGRGGSTWLAQLLAQARGMHLLWEPLHWRTNPESRKLGFQGGAYVPPDADDPETLRYVADILSGRGMSRFTNTSIYFNPYSLLRFRGYLVKFVAANMLMPWLVGRLPIRAIYFVRHPCAVVASQVEHGRWTGFTKEFLRNDRLFDDVPHLVPVYDRISTPLEAMAFRWAIENLVPLTPDSPDGRQTEGVSNQIT